MVLIIQVNWIIETSNIKEEMFNEKANIILARTTESLSADTVTCNNMRIHVGKNETRKIDSLFRHYMNFYNFHTNYTFTVIPKPKLLLTGNLTDFQNYTPQGNVACYDKTLDEASNKSGFELKLLFPEKREYINAEMGTMFGTSVFLIAIVLLMFWRTISSLLKEKKISEYTTDFLNNMTHEFKTPLTNIALAGKMITKDTNIKQEDKIKHYSGIILAENEKLRLQVEQVLSMTALERGEIPLQKVVLDFHELIHDAIKSMSLQVENKEGSLKLNFDAQKSNLIGDKTHLTNALCNLIDNAIKYSDDKPELAIQTFNVGQNLIVEVSDKGIGIEKEYQTKVFDKFFRVPTGDVHDVKGFGLGLAYVKKIIELHDGTIELKSSLENDQESKGTTFKIILPYV